MSEPNRPSLTAAQITAAVIALIVPFAALLRSFGVYDLTPEQQSALNDLIVALAGFAAVLVTADAYLRGKRNDAHAKVAAVAAVKRNEAPAPLMSGPTPGPSSTSADVFTRTAPTTVTGVAHYEEDEPGDADALPDYETTTVVPPDEGDSAPEAQA